MEIKEALPRVHFKSRILTTLVIGNKDHLVIGNKDHLPQLLYVQSCSQDCCSVRADEGLEEEKVDLSLAGKLLWK